MIIINAPSALSIAYSIIRPFMDDVTRKKTIILSTREQWQPALEELIDREQIPQMYGGLAANLTPEQAFDSLNPPQCCLSESTAPASTTATASSVTADSSTSMAASVDCVNVTVELPNTPTAQTNDATSSHTSVDLAMDQLNISTAVDTQK